MAFLQQFSDDTWGVWRHTRLSATRGLVLIKVRHMSSHLSYRAARAPIDAATVFTSPACLRGDLVLVANVGARVDAHDEDINQKG